MKVRGRGRGLALLVAGILAAIAAGLAATFVFGDGGDPPQYGPVGEDEVRGVVDRFARAFADEDGEALGRTLSINVERVLPGGRQRGRATVVEEYRRQFRGSAIKAYDLTGLAVTGGDVGRAEGRYTVRRTGAASFGGGIVFGVVRERGRVRIDLIAATPDT